MNGEMYKCTIYGLVVIAIAFIIALVINTNAIIEKNNASSQISYLTVVDKQEYTTIVNSTTYNEISINDSVSCTILINKDKIVDVIIALK